jgi:hypothetical protein
MRMLVNCILRLESLERGRKIERFVGLSYEGDIIKTAMMMIEKMSSLEGNV